MKNWIEKNINTTVKGVTMYPLKCKVFLGLQILTRLQKKVQKNFDNLKNDLTEQYSPYLSGIKSIQANFSISCIYNFQKAETSFTKQKLENVKNYLKNFTEIAVIHVFFLHN